ncbi:hypothetical protein GW7_19115 [Heterocephalus glaber]|uniref:Uncharacterized protein n=1 Tax=Heterocephalus glaber TaxID=10181 RepID=G5BNJ2_HETGA|nr:hypothetical protein GW7_19115 [Heterocephalus glaber]
MSLEGTVARGMGDAKYRVPGDLAGEHCLEPATGRSHINTFTVRPGTRHPISYASSRAHRKAMS